MPARGCTLGALVQNAGERVAEKMSGVQTEPGAYEVLARSYDVIPPEGEGGWTEAEEAVAAAFAAPDWVGWYAVNASVWTKKGQRPLRRQGGRPRRHAPLREGEYEVDALVFTPGLMVLVEAKFPVEQRGTLWVPRDGDWSIGPVPGLVPVKFQRDETAARNPRKQLRSYCSSIGPRVRVLKPENWDLRGVVAVHGEGVLIQAAQPQADTTVCTTAPADLRATLARWAAREPQTWAAWQVLRAIEILDLDVPEAGDRRAFVERLVEHGFPPGDPPDHLRADLGLPPRAILSSGKVYRGDGVGTKEVISAAPRLTAPQVNATPVTEGLPPPAPAPPHVAWRPAAGTGPPPRPPFTVTAPPKARSPKKRSKSRWRLTSGIGGFVVALVALSLLGLLVKPSDPTTGLAPKRSLPSASSPRQLVGSRTFVARVKQRDRTCRGHVVGAAAQRWLSTTPCTLRRAMFTTTVQGRPVVVAVAVADLGTARRASSLRDLVAGGGGRVKTLLSEGKRFPGAPARIEAAASAAAVHGTTAVFTLADYATGTSSVSDAALQALSLKVV